MIQSQPWRRQAACLGADTARFYPAERMRGREKRTHERAAIVRYCARCPVTEECLAYAFAVDERAGVWGGTTPDERKALRSRRQPAAQLTN